MIAAGADDTLALATTRQVTTSYGYDRLYRLTSGGTPGTPNAYTYDPNGNRLSLTQGLGTPTNYVYDQADRLQSVGGQSYTVDANGNLTAYPGATLAYDQANRLKTATISGTTTTYVYDGDGKRASKTVGSTPTSYAYDANRSLPVVLTDGALKYVWGNGLAYATDYSGNVVDVYHTDELGSVRAITNVSGVITQTYQTDEFGVASLVQGTSGQPFGFTGEQQDAESGFVDLRARYYDPSLGRFLSRDQVPGVLANPLSLNRYTYVQGNPTNWTDPNGECGIRCIVQVARWVGAGAAAVAARGSAILQGINQILQGAYAPTAIEVGEELAEAGVPGADEIAQLAQDGDPGALRVLRVVQQIGPERVSGFEQAYRTPYGTVRADIVDSAGNLIEVGGPGKNIDPSGFGRQMARYAQAAQDLGVKAQFYYDAGTPQNILDIAARRLGAENVIPMSEP